MMRKWTTITLTLTAVLAFGLGTALGSGDIRDGWQLVYPDVCSELVDAGCNLCHGSGLSLNDYALDYLDNGQDWLAIEDLDSDGDTVSNGQEINVDCTLPGDPTSVTANDEYTWGSIKALYN